VTWFKRKQEDPTERNTRTFIVRLDDTRDLVYDKVGYIEVLDPSDQLRLMRYRPDTAMYGSLVALFHWSKVEMVEEGRSDVPMGVDR